MMYVLEDLLTKMGAPELKDKNFIGWHYFDKENKDMAGFAEIKLLNDGQLLVAELKHQRHDYEDDFGNVHPDYTESFYLYAAKQGNQYKIMKIAFDDEEYAHPQKSIVELGLGIFYARALDISILMMEQSFNKQDILTPIIDEEMQLHRIPAYVKDVFKKESSWGEVVPFKPRQTARFCI